MKIHRRQFLKGVAGFTAFSLVNNFPNFTYADYYSRTLDLHNGNLATALKLLNYGYGGNLTDTSPTHVPALINTLYSSAYNILDENKSRTFADVAANSSIQTLCDSNGIAHMGGPMLGDLTSTGVKVWVRTFRPAAVKIRVTTPNGDVNFGPVNSTAASEHVAIVLVTGLEPNTSYSYSVLVDDTSVSIPANAAIVTGSREDITVGNVRIAFGTCPHRWGLGNSSLFDRIRGRNPSVMLLGGDIAVQDRNNDIAMHRADTLLRDFQPPWQNFVAKVPVYATWDDHDYFDNDLAGIPSGYTDADRKNVCKVFRNSWNNPAYGFSKGVFFRTRVGPCDVIMLDNRYFRNQSTDTHKFLGDAQMDWLEAQLLDCKGPFIILSCGTMWSDYVSDGKDSWGTKDPDGRERILNFIEQHNIPGVVLISGDRHGTRGFRVPRSSGFNFYEFEMGSLGGRTGPLAKDPSWTTQLFGYSGIFAFGEFDIDATKKDPELTFRLIKDDGSELYNLTLKRSQLTPKSFPVADLNKDGRVDLADLGILSKHWMVSNRFCGF